MVAETKRVKKVTRTTKGKRADLRAARLEQRKGNTRTRFVNEKVKTKRKPPVKNKTRGSTTKGGVTTKSGVRKTLRKFGVPGKIIAGVLALTAANQLSKPKATPKKVAAKPAAKPAVKPARRRGPSGPTMTSMKAPSTGPKPRNKNVTRRPKRPSGPRMTGFRK